MSARKRHRGFTLTEVVAALVILAVGVPPAMWALREAALRRANPVLTTRARWLASARMEQIIADRHSPLRGYDFLQSDNYPDESAVSGAPMFARTVEFDETGPDLVTAGTGFMTVRVRVQWNDAIGQPRELELATLLTEYAP
ncbi:MAG: prepilin-type N-terminal cleavage/methylation domain-containing protein [Phycisphaerales bacterium JB039]